MSRRVTKKKSDQTALKHHTVHHVNKHLIHDHIGIYSRYLHRKVNVDIFRPAVQDGPLQVLLLNDGQDAKILKLEKTLTSRYSGDQPGVLVAGIHAGDRLHEYGTAGIPDYMGRGSKAADHLSFVLNELLPFIDTHYNANTASGMAYAGFSLGGLSALDAVWKHPDRFTRAGVFSGSLWWRRKPVNGVYQDTDRIMHGIIAGGPYKPELSFWFQAGTNDEKADRNNNGIIDAIDDTLDLIAELKSVGYTDNDLHYHEVEGGEHNFHTWSAVFPDFLDWAFPAIPVTI